MKFHSICMDLFLERYSCRKFSDKEIPEELVQNLVEAIRMSPTAGNLQSYKVFVISNKQVIQEIKTKSYNRDFFSVAPLLLVFCSDLECSAAKYKERGETLYSIQDATICCTVAHYKISQLGLATCWTGAFDELAVKEILNIKGQLRPIAMLPVGYAAQPEHIPPKNRFDVKEKFIFID